MFRKTDLDPVTPADAEEAKRALQRTTSFDIDEFLQNSTVDVLFNSPLGPTAHCLSIDEIAAVKRATLDASRQAHLASCAACAEHLRIYESMGNIQWDDVSRDIDILRYIRVPAGGNLFLVLRNLGNETILAGLEPETIRIAGAIDGKGNRIDELDPTRYNATEAVAVHFGKDFKLNVPDTGEVLDYVDLYATTAKGPLCKRQLVQIIDESKAGSVPTANAV